jgi:hypothetical protein
MFACLTQPDLLSQETFKFAVFGDYGDNSLAEDSVADLINIVLKPDSFLVGNYPLPVELSSFQGEYLNESIRLYWTTTLEIDNYGFQIERSINKTNWTSIGFVEGTGASNIPREYKFFDYSRLMPKKYITG